MTGFPGSDDSNSYWVVHPLVGEELRQGEAVKNGDIIRLQHSNTRRWLHSHLHPSPISSNFEVR